jgi:hypothetical protein
MAACPNEPKKKKKKTKGGIVAYNTAIWAKQEMNNNKKRKWA